LLGHVVPPFAASTSLEQIIRSLDACGLQALGVFGPDTFDFFDLVNYDRLLP
jgi:hypothetical protein